MPPLPPAVLSLLIAGALAAGTAAAQTSDHATLSPERAPLPPGQVWQCVHDGRKTFSDVPCGNGATIRQLNDVNIMDPAPAERAPGYPPRVAYPEPAPYRDAQSSDYGDASDTDPVYVTQQVIGVNAVQRAGRPSRPRPLERPPDRGHAAQTTPAAPAAHVGAATHPAHAASH